MSFWYSNYILTNTCSFIVELYPYLSFKELFQDKKSVFIHSFNLFEQYHEENAQIEVYSNERFALDALNCGVNEPTLRPPSLLTVDEEETDVEEVKDFLAKDARRKREEEMLADDARNFIDSNVVATTPSRGDIPSSAIESCDGKTFI